MVAPKIAPPGWTPPRFAGGRLCLDFCNSVGWRAAQRVPDRLEPGYAALLAWAEARGVLDPQAASRLAKAATAAPEAAAEVHAQALALRAELDLLVDALAEGRGVPAEAVAALNARLAAAPKLPPLAPAPDGSFRHDLPGEDLGEPLLPVLWSAAALLASGETAQVGRCQAEGCGWVFLDTSRKHSRLWCSAETCGNRTRARRHHARRRGLASGDHPA
jgi:predicted RNA-binding Zn ribbon-like protein